MSLYLTEFFLFVSKFLVFDCSVIPETKEIVNNIVNKIPFADFPSLESPPFPSPTEKLQASSYNPLVSSVSEHLVSHLELLTLLENEVFIDIAVKEVHFANFKNNIISSVVSCLRFRSCITNCSFHRRVSTAWKVFK